jgi:hypothetical protein
LIYKKVEFFHFSFDTLSCFLVACPAIQVTWHSGGWSFSSAKKYHHAARQIATTIVSRTLKAINLLTISPLPIVL